MSKHVLTQVNSLRDAIRQNTDEQTCQLVMQGSETIKECASLEAFIEDEIQNSSKGSELARDGDARIFKILKDVLSCKSSKS